MYGRSVKEFIVQHFRYGSRLSLARLAFPVHGPRQYLTSGYQGTLGHAYPSALGAKIALPDRAVVALTARAASCTNVQELATAVQHGIAVVAIVFNDGAYGNVRRMQREFYGNRVIASDLVNPDFVRLADRFGVFARNQPTIPMTHAMPSSRRSPATRPR